MTDTLDWADEEADGLCAAGEYVGQCKAVATALRAAFLRGRVAQLRELSLHAMADKLESGA